MHRQVHNQQAHTKATYKLKVNENLKHLYSFNNLKTMEWGKEQPD